jgi:hypothetical protein
LGVAAELGTSDDSEELHLREEDRVQKENEKLSDSGSDIFDKEEPAKGEEKELDLVEIEKVKTLAEKNTMIDL